MQRDDAQAKNNELIATFMSLCQVWMPAIVFRAVKTWPWDVAAVCLRPFLGGSRDLGSYEDSSDR